MSGELSTQAKEWSRFKIITITLFENFKTGVIINFIYKKNKYEIVIKV